MVDDNDKVEAESVMTYTKNLQRFFSDTKIAYLHGRMKASEKAVVMEGFADGSVQILVSTTVVEVGVNVPNATVIIIENAERFGLAQLLLLKKKRRLPDWMYYSNRMMVFILLRKTYDFVAQVM